ncbi:MAG: AAA family ATPase, partial [Ruthenibacterium sp.]
MRKSKMIITELTLTNLRNIASAHFCPAPELTVIYGKNGQGKTNLLESVWLLTGSKSFRGAKDIELVRENAPFAVLDGVTGSLEKQNNIRIVISAGARCELAESALIQENKGPPQSIAAEPLGNSLRKGRTAKVNGVDFGRATNLAGIFTAVVFDPGHLSLIKGSPEGRRRFLDAALCQLYPQYLSLYRRYTRLVMQKNALLKAYYTTQGA